MSGVWDVKTHRRASDYAFPYPDGNFDFTFLTSAFTHVLPRDVEHGAYAKLPPMEKAHCTALLVKPDPSGKSTDSSRVLFAPGAHSFLNVRFEEQHRL